MFGPDDYEKLGLLYLGRTLDPRTGTAMDRPMLYDARHLLTHAVIVGMTGSGKTGLASVLLEEAAIDGVPAIVIDPKGDLGNLLLTFPELRAEDFAPWVAAGESPAEVARRAREGLAETMQVPARIARFAETERTIYTPGASSGARLSIAGSLAAPNGSVDVDALRERAVAATSALLSLTGVEIDPLRSPEHTLVTNVLLDAWSRGLTFDLAALLRAIQSPPFAQLGVMDLESVIPAKARQSLALAINNAFASPAFAAFLEGEPLDVERLLWTRDGKPRISIVSLSHLSDHERIFFVTLLLGAVVSWMRTQPGTSSLRALLYMDEVTGFFPPVATPPSKAPMLTLLKQARAFGLGVVLATQNPVDLDYKGLSNAGTWMLGRLQTERDKFRVLEGLEGAAQSQGHALDRAALDALLSSLPKRTFLLHDVNDAAPTTFQTRWALSFLRGPMTRAEIARVTSDQASRNTESGTYGHAQDHISQVDAPTAGSGATAQRPIVSPDVDEAFLVGPQTDTPQAPLVYRPHVMAKLAVHYVMAKLGADAWLTPVLLAPFDGEAPAWERAWVSVQGEPTLAREPTPGVYYAPLPSSATRGASYAAWSKSVAAHVYKDRPLVLCVARELDLVSTLGETREAFLSRVALAAREARDAAVQKLRDKFRARVDRAQRAVAAAEQRVQREQAQRNAVAVDAGLAFGSNVLGALFGRGSAVRGAMSAARQMNRGAREQGDVARAEQALTEAREALAMLEREVQAALASVAAAHDLARIAIEDVSVAAKKADSRVERIALVWVPSA